MNQLVGVKDNGAHFLMLVLEPANLRKLQNGSPITMRIEDMFPAGIPGRLELAIAFSETPVADARVLTRMAEVALDERTPVAQKKRPHCPECRSTLEQLGMFRSDESPVAMVFCPACGCTLGIHWKA